MVTTQEQVDLLWDRFVHQSETFAEQRLMSRRGEEAKEWRFRRAFRGRCTHTPPCPRKSCPDVYAPALSRDDLADHIAGKNTIGVYQTYENTVKWVCLDVDISKGTDVTEQTWDDVRQQTKRVAKRAYDLGVPFLVEFSGSRGMHLWVFFDVPVQASKAYAFGHFIVSAVDVIEGLHIEVYPKQPYTPNLGNLVKLPLGIHRKSNKRTTFVRPSFKPYEDQWGVLNDTPKMRSGDLDAFLAEHGIEHETLTLWTPRDTDHGRGLPCYTNVMTRGVSEGARDELSFRLAVFLKNHGVPEQVTWGAMERWNEHNDPPLDEITLREKVESAYKREYSHFPCMRPEIDPYCDSACEFYENRMRSLKRMKRTR